MVYHGCKLVPEKHWKAHGWTRFRSSQDNHSIFYVSQLAPVNFRSTVANHRKSDGSGLDKIVSDEATPFLKLGAGAGVFHCLNRKIWQILQGGAP